MDAIAHSPSPCVSQAARDRSDPKAVAVLNECVYRDLKAKIVALGG